MFPCTKCGECCRRVNLAEVTRFLDRNDGTCRYFDSITNQCCIYSTRPMICMIDRMYESFYCNSMLKNDFYLVNAKCCNEMQDQSGIDFSFRVKISQSYNEENESNERTVHTHSTAETRDYRAR